MALAPGRQRSPDPANNQGPMSCWEGTSTKYQVLEITSAKPCNLHEDSCPATFHAGSSRGIWKNRTFTPVLSRFSDKAVKSSTRSRACTLRRTQKRLQNGTRVMGFPSEGLGEVQSWLDRLKHSRPEHWLCQFISSSMSTPLVI